MTGSADSAETCSLLQRTQTGDDVAREELLQRHSAVIRRSVQKRIGGRLRARVDPSDVIQETQLDVVQRMDEYLRNRPMSFRLWLIKLAHQRLSKIERYHLSTAKRAASREIPLPDRSSLDLAQCFLSRESSPSRAATDRELARKVRQMLATISDGDREIVMLRNFDHLSNAEAAQVLGIQPEAAKKRYTRALIRMKEALSQTEFGH